MVVEASSWLREAISVIEMLSSVLVAVAPNDSDGVNAEEKSSDASSDVVLLSDGSVSTPVVASGMAFDELGTSDWISELVIASGRSVGCVRMPVGKTRSESVTKELVTSSSILALVVSSDSVTVNSAEDNPDTRLEGTSVMEGRLESSEVTERVASIELKISVV